MTSQVNAGTRAGLDRVALLGAALLFSTGGSVIKATSLSGFQIAFGRSALAAVVLFIAIPTWRRFWDPRAALVGVGYGATLILFVIANKLTTAANAIFLQSTAPLYVLFLAPWLLGERNRPGDVALTSGMLAGLVLFFIGSQDPMATAREPALGNGIAVTAGFTWAWTLVGLRFLARSAVARGEPAAALTGGAVIAGNALAAIACLPFTGPLPALAGIDIAAVAYLGLFQIGLAYVLLTRGIGGVPALEAALLLLLEPVMSAGIAWWVHDEQPGPMALAGCTLILATAVARTLLALRANPD